MKNEDAEPRFGFIGCRASRRIGAPAIMNAFRERGCMAQPVRAGVVFGKEHLLSACMHAERSLERGEGASKDLMTEVALYIGCSSQLSRALALVRIEDESEIVVITRPRLRDADTTEVLQGLDMIRDDTLMDPTNERAANAHVLGIDSTDLATVREAVLEKVALVDLER